MANGGSPCDPLILPEASTPWDPAQEAVIEAPILPPTGDVAFQEYT